MKNEKRLEEKIVAAEEHLPGIKEILKETSSEDGGNRHREYPTDVEFLEVSGQKVVAAKWEARYWSLFGGGVGSSEWVAVYHPVEGEEEIKEIVTNRIETRNTRDARFDKKDLLFHDYVGLEALADDKVEVAWANKDGEKGPTYTIKLE